MLYLSLFIAGGLGVVSRFLSVNYLTKLFGSTFPFGTLLVNIIGSLLFGFLSWYIVQRWAAVANIETVKIAILSGFLGGYTTFSAFSMEALHLLQTGQFAKAILYMLASVVLCVFACFIGLLLAKQIA